MGRGQLILPASTGLVLIRKRDPAVLEARGFDLREHGHEGGKALVQPEVVPPAHGNEIAEPHVGHLVEDDVGAVLARRLGHFRTEDERFVEGDRADVFHSAGRELGHEELVVLLKRIRILVGLAVEVEALLGQGEDLVRVQVLGQRLAAEDAEIDVAVPVSHAVVRTRDDRGQVARHFGRGPEGPALDIFPSGELLGLPGIIGDDDPITGCQHAEGEAGFEIRLIEAGEHAVGIERLELAM